MRRLATHTLVPLFLILVCPPFAMLLWHTLVNLDGSILALGSALWTDGVYTTIRDVWGPVFFGSKTAWTMIGIYAVFEIVLMRFLPGKDFEGPVTPKGNVPHYIANGPLAFAITLGLYCLLSFGLGVFPASIIFDHFGEILGALNFSALVFCLLLYLKGRFAPSSTDNSHSGNFIFDYYWGTELFPRVLGFDIKMFTNCRFAMMGWGLILISYAAAQHAQTGITDAMLVGVGLQLVYIAKFFWWETGYLGSLDIMHDRAGFYIVWGVLVWLPSVYTSPTLYLVNNPTELGTGLAILIFIAGVIAIFTNYFADAQRQRVRATGGETTVWGKEPKLIVAKYTTAGGELKESLLLASGFWGIARHFHYVPEILGAFFWTLPALFTNFLPWFYVSFLTILLVHRALRDDDRCAAKYGSYWDDYRRLVPYRMIPKIF